VTLLRASGRVRLSEATPAFRDRTVDGLRALAMVGVVLGHWLVTGLAAGPDGSLQPSSPLTAMAWFKPVSWLLETLALFFFVSGYSTGLSWTRRRASGRSFVGWLGARLRRLLPPITLFLVVWLLMLWSLARAGVAAGTLGTVADLAASPLWFIGVLVVLLPLTPLAVAAERRFGAVAALGPLVAVAVVDVVRYRLWPQMPGALSYLNVLTAWLVPYVLGIAMAAGRLPRRWGVPLAGIGAAAALLLIIGAHYPVSMVGVPGDGRSNLSPPSLLVVALGLIQIGLALVFWDRVARLMRRTAWWAVVVMLNLSAMTVFLWHQSALLLVSAAGRLLLGSPAGLIGQPDSLGWVIHRLLWLPAFGSVLVVFSVSFRWVETLAVSRRASAAGRGPIPP
jgi:peptidoglycan/LPS O-acetylase OafA/YrhL